MCNHSHLKSGHHKRKLLHWCLVCAARNQRRLHKTGRKPQKTNKLMALPPLKRHLSADVSNNFSRVYREKYPSPITTHMDES